MRATDRPGQLIVAFSPGHADGELVEAAAAVTNGLRQRGVSAVARLLTQSFDPETAITTPADRLSQLLGEPASTICPPKHWYDVDLPAAFAAEALGRPSFGLGDLIGDTHFHPSTAVGVLVVPGGPAAPLAHDGDALALCRKLRPDLVVVVTTPEPTGVNETTLAALAVAPSPVVVALRGFVANEPDHEQTLAWLNARFDVATDVEPIVARIIAPHAATA